MKRTLLATVLAGLIAPILLGPTSTYADLNQGLVAYYPFEGSVSDASGHGMTGSTVGATFTPGRFGLAAQFDGIDDYLILPSSVVGGLPVGTFSTWIFIRSFPRGTGIIASQGLTDCSHFYFSAGSDRRLWTHMCGGVGGARYFAGNPVVPTNAWVMTTFTWDGAYWKLYINGLLETNTPAIQYPVANTDTFKLGRHEHGSGPYFFDGLMDDVRIYNRALSDSEIQQLYAQNAALTGRVTDTNGTSLSGVSVSVWKAGSLVMQTVSDSQGQYAVGALAAGRYDLRAEKAGYDTAPLNGVRIVDGQTRTANFVLSARPADPTIVPTERTPEELPPSGTSILKRFVDGSFQAIASPSEIDRSANTVVFTHGWNSAPGVWATEMAANLRAGGVTDANLLAWDWDENAGTVLSKAFSRTVKEGEDLARGLTNVLGQDYSQGIHFIGHSLGTLVNATAANFLHTQTGGAYNWQKTQMTLLDNAVLANILGKPFAFSHKEKGLLSLLDPELDNALAMKWVWPLPAQFAWADNYISFVGTYEPRAVNASLDSSLWRSGPFIGWHGYACDWYAHTARYPDASEQLGNRHSFERFGVNAQFPSPSPYPLGTLFRQNPFSQYNLINVLDVPAFLADRLDQLADALVEYGVNTLFTIGQKVGDVTVNVTEASVKVWDAVGQRFLTIPMTSFRVALTTSSVGLAATSGGVKTTGEGTPEADNSASSPAAVWLPVEVPTGVALMAFDFAFEGDPGQDVLAVCVNGTNVFELETRFMQSGEILKSGFIDVSAWARQEVELFFGLLGGTSTNASVTIEAMGFYQVTKPSLAVDRVGNAVVISWPASTAGLSLESATDLSAGNWVAVTNALTASGLTQYVTNTVTDTSRFFRLRQN